MFRSIHGPVTDGLHVTWTTRAVLNFFFVRNLLDSTIEQALGLSYLQECILYLPTTKSLKWLSLHLCNADTL
jgi:hypothetical protein